MKNVLVTGASGFIGSRLALRLREEGKNVVALVGHLHGPSQQELFDAGCVGELADVTNLDKMRGLISKHEIDTVFHLAAYSIVRLAARDPLSTYQVNVMGTVNVLEACREVGGVKKVVVASSDKAYGDQSLPYKETMPLLARNTYDVSKACADMIAQSYWYNYDMPVIVTRSSNVYGPGDRNWSRIVPNTIRRLLAGEKPMLYSDVEKMVREFVYIDDVVEAHLAIAKATLDDPPVVNIGGTEHFTVGEAVRKIASAVGKADVETEIVDREPTFREINQQYISSDELRALGWVPQFTLEDGVRETVEWVKENAE